MIIAGTSGHELGSESKRSFPTRKRRATKATLEHRVALLAVCSPFGSLGRSHKFWAGLASGRARPYSCCSVVALGGDLEAGGPHCGRQSRFRSWGTPKSAALITCHTGLGMRKRDHRSHPTRFYMAPYLRRHPPEITLQGVINILCQSKPGTVIERTLRASSFMSVHLRLSQHSSGTRSAMPSRVPRFSASLLASAAWISASKLLGSVRRRGELLYRVPSFLLMPIMPSRRY
jgi:hypothetical protein